MHIAPFSVRLGYEDEKAYLRIDVVGYEHPDVAEPDGLDLMSCIVIASAAPVSGRFEYSIRVAELLDLRHYLAEINSGNGPPAAFSIAGGLVSLSFAPSRRGPVLCAILLKSIEASHVRLEFLVTLEPEAITRALADFAPLNESLEK